MRPYLITAKLMRPSNMKRFPTPALEHGCTWLRRKKSSQPGIDSGLTNQPLYRLWARTITSPVLTNYRNPPNYINLSLKQLVTVIYKIYFTRPSRGKMIFPLASVSRPALGPTQPPVRVPGVKARPGRDADHSPPSSSKIRNE
jgi:hypothetical protein